MCSISRIWGLSTSRLYCVKPYLHCNSEVQLSAIFCNFLLSNLLVELVWNLFEIWVNIFRGYRHSQNLNSPLLWPLVGGSLASDWVRFSKSNRRCPTMYHLNVEVYNHSPSYILVIPLYICIWKTNGHYQHRCRALHHTLVATCWRFSCASDWVWFSKSNRLSDNVSPKRGGIQPLPFLYIGNSFMYMYIKDQWPLSAPL